MKCKSEFTNERTKGKRKMTSHYAGIGSRETPPQVLEQMRKIGTFLAERNYILRSGVLRELT